MRRFAAALAYVLLAGAAAAQPSAGPVIRIEDVARFYRVYDAAHGHPTALALQRGYLDPGTDGLHRYVTERNETAERIADAIAKHPEYYAGARRCMTELPKVRERVRTALQRLGQLYPEAQFPPVTIAVGRGKPVGIADASGVIIGLEALCSVKYFDPDVEDRFVHVIAHEYTHVQQARIAPAFYNDPKPTVLEESLIEGAAEFTAELVSGAVSNPTAQRMAKEHEKEIETAFAADENKTDLSRWLYNGTMDKSGDLGYWVGYRIVKSYYQHAADKRAALRGILEMTDPKAFLAASGWYPGIRLRAGE